MSQALYRKWRPQSWQAVVGQDHVIQTLRNAIGAGRVAHAYLFAGPRGTGKTTTARLLAKAVNCLDEDLAVRPCGQCAHCQLVNQGRFLDLIEIDAASNTSVEDVRDLRDKINFSPNQGRYKVYIVDEVHMLSTAAFNALLKTLEEPPSHAIFILATTEVHKIPATVLSRCQRHEFRRIPVAEIANYLKDMAVEEGIEVEPEVLTLLARQSTGAMRDAISLLDQLASTGEVITLALAQSVLGTATSQAVLDVIQALIDRKPAAGLDTIHQALDAGSDPRQFARQIVDYLRDLLLVKTNNTSQLDVTADLLKRMKKHAGVFATADLLRLIRLFNSASNEARAAWQPALPLEMAFVEALENPEGPAEPGESPARQTASRQTEAPHSVTRQTPPQQVAARPPEASPLSAPPAGDDTFQRVVSNWPQVLRNAKGLNSSMQGLLNSCKLAGMKDGVLFLSFNSEILRRKMETDDNLQLARKAIAETLGQEIPLACFVTTGSGQLPPDVDSDGMVAAALRDLGGEIVDIQ